MLQVDKYGIMNRRIVPVEPASGYGEIVVIEVQQEGVHEFDVRLVGCEGENPYIANSKGGPDIYSGCFLDMMQSNKARSPN